MDTIPQGLVTNDTRKNETHHFMTVAAVTKVSFHPCSITNIILPYYTANSMKKQGAFLTEIKDGTEAKSMIYDSKIFFP